MNPTFGASILSWIPPMWTPEGGLFAIQQASAAGFDLLEILLPPSMEFDAPTVKRQLKQHGLKATCSLNLPQEAHIPFYPKEALSSLYEQTFLDARIFYEHPFVFFINFLKTSKQAKQNFHFTCFKITPLPVSSPTRYSPQ